MLKILVCIALVIVFTIALVAGLDFYTTLKNYLKRKYREYFYLQQSGWIIDTEIVDYEWLASLGEDLVEREGWYVLIVYGYRIEKQEYQGKKILAEKIENSRDLDKFRGVYKKRQRVTVSVKKSDFRISHLERELKVNFYIWALAQSFFGFLAGAACLFLLLMYLFGNA